MPVEIQDFKFNNKPWCILWLGRLIYPSSRSEPRITVHLVELIPDFSDPLSTKSQSNPPQYKTATVKVGAISLLKIGSVWLNGRQIPVHTKQIECSISHEKCQLTRFDSKAHIGDGVQPIFTPLRYRVGPEALRESAGSWVVLLNDPSPSVRLLVIPATVLFQRAFATSPKAVRRLVYGQIDKIATPSSEASLEDISTFFILLFKDFRDSEAPALANIFADPIASQEYNRFRNTLMIESANHTQYRQLATHIKLSLPFKNPAQLTANGKYMPFAVMQNSTERKEWGFLVTEITDLQVKLCFDRLIVDRKNNSRQGLNADNQNLTPAWGGSIRTPVDLEDPLFTSAEEPVDDLEAACIEAAGSIVDPKLQIIRDQKLVQQYKARAQKRRDDGVSDGTVSTGDVGAGHGSTTDLNIETAQAPEIPITLDAFFETLAQLTKKGYPFRTIPVSTTFRQRTNNTGIVNFLPRRISGVRSWHLISEFSDALPRGYIVAELCYGGVWRYLIEIQRKGAEAIALLYLRDHTGKRIEKPELAKFMIDVAVENGWGAKDLRKSWVGISIKHQPKKGMEIFVQGIIKQLQSNGYEAGTR